MKKYAASFLLVLVGFLLQVSVLPAFTGTGIRPNIMIILVASFGFMNGEKSGMAMGFACGLLTDIFFGSAIGLYTLLYVLAGYLNGLFQRVFYPEELKLPLMLILGSDVGLNFVCYCLLFLLRSRLNIVFYLFHVILPEAVFTFVIAVAVYPLLLFLHKKLEQAEKRSNE